MRDDAELLATLEEHLRAIYDGDFGRYQASTAPDLTLYEYFVTPHRQEGLAFHQFMIERRWATGGAPYQLSLLEPKVQWLAEGQVSVASYTLLLSVSGSELTHRTHNETRVLEKREGRWVVVHVHKSPAGANG